MEILIYHMRYRRKEHTFTQEREVKMDPGYPSKNQYLKSLMQSFLAIGGIVLLLIVYHLIIFRMEGGAFEQPVKTLRIIAAFMYKQKEWQQSLFAVCFSFLLINFAPQRIKSSLYRIFIFIVSLWVFYRTFNLAHVFYAGSHLGKDFISHIDKSSVSMMSDIKALLLLVVIPVPVIFTMHFLFKKLDLSRYGLKMKCSVLLVLSLILYSLTAVVKNDVPSYLWMSEFRYYYPAASQVPEKYLASSFKRDVSKVNSTAMQETLPASAKGKLKDIFGLHINEKDRLPLSKEHIFTGKFPYPGVDKRSASPNIILIAAEGLSSKLLGHYGSPYRGISPEFDAFAKGSLVIKPFYNSSLPTINGLVSMVCSHYPVTGHEDWIDNKGVMKYDLLCLPEVLKKRGYHSYNIVPGDPYFAKQAPFMKANGMDEVYGALKIREVLRENPYGRVFQETAYSDDQIMRSLIESLKTGSFKEPFLVVLSTDDLHPPFRLPKDAVKYAQQENPILHIVHTMDTAFGRFWEYYKKSAYSGNTIVILTADHALFPGIEYKKLTGDKGAGYYDEIPLIIHDPTHKLPGELIVNSSSVDIVPSLLHLLDINIPNPFEGASVFDSDGRMKHRGVLGSHQYLFFFRVNNENSSFMQEDIKCDNMRNDAAQSSASKAFTVCDYRDWWRYKRWLVENNRIWQEK
jgi:phosphoglycerol transferase MdoB-like AlkP superfamily enzyme